LVCVCFLLQGDVKIVAEEDLAGKFVQAHGHFEFMLKRGTKAVCRSGGVGCRVWNCDKLCSVDFFLQSQ
jgi:hypothetical protein